MEKQNATVTAIKFTDVRGKFLYYLKIETEAGETIINIGDKTFNRVESLTKPKEEDETKTKKK